MDGHENEALHRLRALRRRHKLTKDEVDALPWPHPRPARDPRLLYVHLALLWTAAAWATFGPPKNTVPGRAWGNDWVVTVLFSLVLAVCCGLYFAAAFCKSQYESFGYESGACMGFAGMMGIYAWQGITSTPAWGLTQLTPLILALMVGNAHRAFILIRRLW